MTRRRSVGTRIKHLGYHLFYRLPPQARRRLVRLVAPTYTVGAVVLARDPDGQLLLVRQPPGFGWSLPSGMMDRGESPAECAVRELAEETGVVVAVENLEPMTPNAVPHIRGRWIDFVYQVRVYPDQHRLVADGGEVLEACWHSEQGLPPLTVPTARLLARFGLGPYQVDPEDTAR